MSTRRRLMMQSVGGGGTYIDDALSFHVDGEDFNGVNWIDRVGGLTFYNIGNVVKGDRCAIFNGSNYLQCDTKKTFPYDDGTIEVAIEPSNDNRLCVLASTDATSMALSIDSIFQWVSVIGTGYCWYRGAIQISTIRTLSISKDSVVINGIDYSRLTGKHPLSWSDVDAKLRIGYNKNIGNYYMVGNIYSIRMHSRLLSAEEMMYNQQIDNARFHLGL